MKKIHQKIVASDGTGDCVRSAVASILDLEYEEVPDMSPNTGNQMGILLDFMKKNGYDFKGDLFNEKYNILYYANQFEYCKGEHILCQDCLITEENMNKLNGVNGLFLATVLSPKFTIPYQGKWGHHQVICDSKLNIVFDPNPEYINIKKYPLDDLLGYNGICYLCIFEKSVQ